MSFENNKNKPDRRDWYPSTIPFVTSDFEDQHLIIHCWAKWNSVDREMDNLLSQVIPQFQQCVVFRSLDVDQSEFHDICHDAGVANIPALIFYNGGDLFQTLIGWQQQSKSDAIATLPVQIRSIIPRIKP